MTDFSISEFPASRLATIDVCAIGKLKHHMYALLECDVTDSRSKIRVLKQQGRRISFTGWLLTVISHTLTDYKEAAAFLYNGRKLIIFDNVKISLIVEKNLNGTKVPFPLVIEGGNYKSIEEITKEIEVAKDEVVSEESVVLSLKPGAAERLYYILPGFFRRIIWKIILKSPRFAYKKMGNVAFTSVGMFGHLKGWFLHTSVHPLSFGVGSVIKKPVVINDEVKIREILNMTVLIDHDVIDGAPMVRFISNLVKCLENGHGL